MPTATYIPLATITLSSTDSEIVFGSIPSGYKDLVLVADYNLTAGAQNMRIRTNSDTGSNYTYVEAGGDGSSPFSSSNTYSFMYAGYVNTTGRTMSVTHLMDYSATDKHKTALTRFNKSDNYTIMIASRWANTNAINTLSISPQTTTFTVGSTFSLYGIAG